MDSPKPTRRDLARLAALTGGALAASAVLGRPRALQAEEEGGDEGSKSLKLLILGGTGFLGPAIVDAAVERGHTVTLFNRGKTNPHLYPDLEKLRGDRDGKLDALKGRSWDAVIDTSAYVPRIAGMSAALLADHVAHYTFVSTISVYPGFGTSNETITEATEVGTLEDPTVEQVTGKTYGPLKALCEAAVEKHFPGRTANVRPGLIVGPLDKTDRFTYWPHRIAQGGTVLAPGDGTAPFQVVDARDLGAWLVHCAEKKVVGVYNATGFEGPVSIREVLHALKMELNTKTRFTWIDEASLKKLGVQPWRHLPMWMPSDVFPLVSNAKAVAAGLTFRSIARTAADTLAWRANDPKLKDRPLRAGMSLEQESTFLAAWSAMGGSEAAPAAAEGAEADNDE